MSGRQIALLIMDAKDNTVPTLSNGVPDVLTLLPTVVSGQVYRIEVKTPDPKENAEPTAEE